MTIPMGLSSGRSRLTSSFHIQPFVQISSRSRSRLASPEKRGVGGTTTKRCPTERRRHPPGPQCNGGAERRPACRCRARLAGSVDYPRLTGRGHITARDRTDRRGNAPPPLASALRTPADHRARSPMPGAGFGRTRGVGGRARPQRGAAGPRSRDQASHTASRPQPAVCVTAPLLTERHPADRVTGSLPPGRDRGRPS